MVFSKKQLRVIRVMDALCDEDDDLTGDGGPGSGNWGHKGRPGHKGGSGKGGGKHNRQGSKEEGYSRRKQEPEEAVFSNMNTKRTAFHETGKKGPNYSPSITPRSGATQQIHPSDPRMVKTLTGMGFKYWQSGDGSKQRLYINPKYLGLDIQYGKRYGKIESATFNGRELSNAEVSRLSQIKCYVDLNDGTVHAEAGRWQEEEDAEVMKKTMEDLISKASERVQKEDAGASSHGEPSKPGTQISRVKTSIAARNSDALAKNLDGFSDGTRLSVVFSDRQFVMEKRSSGWSVNGKEQTSPSDAIAKSIITHGGNIEELNN